MIPNPVKDKGIKAKGTNRFSSFSIIIIFSGLSLFGFLSIPFLPVCYAPAEQTNTIEISFSNFDHNPVLFERDVISSIEGLLLTRDFAGSAESVTGKSGAKLRIKLKKGADKALALFHTQQVVRSVERTTNGIDYEAEVGFLETGGRTARPFLTLVMMYEGFERTNYFSEYLRSEIISHPGIKNVILTGIPVREMHIELNYNSLLFYDISPVQLADKLRQHFTGKTIGFDIYSVHSYQGVHYLPIQNSSGQLINLNDITRASGVKESYFPCQYRYGGRKAIKMEVIPEKGTNYFILSGRVIDKIKEIASGSGDPEILIIENSTRQIKDEIFLQVSRIGFTMTVFLLLILLFYRDLKFLITVLSGLIATMLVSFLLLAVLGTGLHIYSLAGLVIAFTVILDNALMMTDHIRTKGQRGIILPMAAASLTTIASLSLIFLVPEIRSAVHIDLAVIIIINLVVSFFVSLFLIPAIYQKFKSGKIPVSCKPGNKRYKLLFWFFRLGSISRVPVICFLLLFIGLPIHRIPSGVNNESISGSIFNKTLGSPFYRENILPVAVKVLGGAYRLFDYYVEKRLVTEEKKTGHLTVNLQSKPGLPYDVLIKKVGEIEYMACQPIWESRVQTKIHNNDDATVTLWFPTIADAVHFRAILSRDLMRSGELQWSITGMGSPLHNRPNESLNIDYLLEFKGYNQRELDIAVEDFFNSVMINPRINSIMSLTPGQNIKEGHRYPEIVLKSPQNSLFMQEQAILPANLSFPVFDKDDFSMLKINLELPQGLLWGQSGESKGFFAKDFSGEDPGNALKAGSVYKKDQEYIRRFGLSYLGNKGAGEAFLSSRINSKDVELPPGFSIVIKKPSGGRELSKQVYFALGALIYLILTIISVLFGSIRKALVIIFIIPVSVSSVFLSYYLTGVHFNEGGIVAAFLVSGLSVNSAVYILYNYQVCLKDDNGGLMAFYKAFLEKAKPSGLTLIATVAGFLPFLVFSGGSGFWFSLSTGAVGGIIIALPLLLLSLTIAIKRNVR